MAAFVRKWRVVILAIVLFIVFKIAFPHPDIFTDSANYLQWGLDNYQIAFRPLGYSTFLMWFQDMPNNYINIVVVQFAVFVACCWYFNVTLFKLFRIKPKFQWIFWLLTLYNPLAYFLVNFISPDSLFISLSALWMATLLRFVFFEDKKYINLGIHLLCFIFLFYLRYNALYYPVFSVVVILFCNVKMPVKAIFISSSLAVFGFIYHSACENAEREVGVSILSGFGGWAMVNNATHIYDEVKVDSNIFDDPEQQMLHRFVVMFKDSINTERAGNQVTDKYLWSKAGPFKKYLAYCLNTGRYTDYVSGWWNVSILYNDFGKTLIKHYPGAFLRTFYIPNLGNYISPPPEVFEKYNPYNQGLTDRWQAYFDYKGEYFTERFPGSEHHIVVFIKYLYVVLSSLTILASLVSIVLFLKNYIKQRGKNIADLQVAGFLLSSFYLISVALLTFAHPVLMRYISFLLLFFSTLPLLILITYNKRAANLYIGENTPTS